jgi:hypothetical protein
LRYNPLYKQLHEKEVNTPLCFQEKLYRRYTPEQLYPFLYNDINERIEDLSFILREDDDYLRAYHSFCDEGWIYAPEPREAVHTDPAFILYSKGVSSTLQKMVDVDKASNYHKKFTKLSKTLSTMGLFDSKAVELTKEGTYVFGVNHHKDKMPISHYTWFRNALNKIDTDETLEEVYDEDPRSPKNMGMQFTKEEVANLKFHFSHLPKNLNEETLVNIEMLIDTGTARYIGQIVRGAYGDYVFHALNSPSNRDTRMFREWGYETDADSGKKVKKPKASKDEIETQEQYTTRTETYKREYDDFSTKNNLFEGRHEALKAYILENVVRWYNPDKMTNFEAIPSKKVFVARSYATYYNYVRTITPLTITQVFDGMLYIAVMGRLNTIFTLDTSIHNISELCFNNMEITPNIKMLTRGWLDTSDNNISDGESGMISAHNNVGFLADGQVDRRRYHDITRKVKAENAQSE